LDHQVEVILHTVVRYTGSQQQQHHDEPNTTPTYRNIQDYAEAIRVTFDPAMIRYEELVDVFFKLARPVHPLWATTQYIGWPFFILRTIKKKWRRKPLPNDAIMDAYST